MVHVTLEAETEQEIDEKINNYFRSFHPAGYGTHLRTKGQNEQGKWIAVLNRARSCD